MRDDEPSLLATMTSGLADFITLQGGVAERVSVQAGLRLQWDDTPNAPIPLPLYCRVLQVAADETGNADFGLAFGRQFPLEALGLLGYLLLSCPTLGAALAQLVDGFALHQQRARIQLRQSRGQCHLIYHSADSSPDQQRHLSELLLAVWQTLLRQALGTDWTPQAVHFAHRPPACDSAHRQLFGPGVRFNQPQHAIIFATAALDRPMPGYDRRLMTLAKHSLQMLGQRDKIGHNVVEQVKHALPALLAQGKPRLDDVAHRLNMPSWTLRRHLVDCGVTFKTLIETTRRELALDFLEQDQGNISTLSARLGYAETSALSRAFQRWYGLSPKQWQSRANRCAAVPDSF